MSLTPNPRCSCRNSKTATTQDIDAPATAADRIDDMLLSASATTGAASRDTVQGNRVEYNGLWGEYGKVCSGRRHRRLRRAPRSTATPLYCPQIVQGLAHNAPSVRSDAPVWMVDRHGCENRASGRAQKSITSNTLSLLGTSCGISGRTDLL
jgi:hypothetical protein